MKTLSLKIPDSLLTRVNSEARERGESRSAIIREAIESFLSNTTAHDRNSCLDLAHDLAGSVKGTKDLSFNKGYMKGYGQ